MAEKRSKTLKELAAELVGQQPEELLNFALYPGGVTLVGKDGRKARLRWEPLVGWVVEEDGGRETGDGGGETGDGGRETGDRGRKKGGKR